MERGGSQRVDFSRESKRTGFGQIQRTGKVEFCVKQRQAMEFWRTSAKLAPAYSSQYHSITESYEIGSHA